MNPMPSQMPDELHERVKILCEEGDDHAKAERFSEAIATYWTAWDLLPEQKVDWEAATWILAAIGDANFLSGDYQAGRDNLAMAMRCSGAIGNPFLHLRLGQCEFELGDRKRASDDLARAFLLAGDDIFNGADEKYLSFVKSVLKPPDGGWQKRSQGQP